MVKNIRFLIISISFLLAFIINASLSLAASDWIWPVKGEIITPFSFDISNYYTSGQHTGIDIKADEGTSLVAPIDGKVYWTAKNPFGRGGVGISIDHNNDISTTYFGLKEAKVKKGDLIKKGDVIAIAGNDGDRASSDMPHLHFGVFRTSSRSSQKTEYLAPVNFLPSLYLEENTPEPALAPETVAIPEAVTTPETIIDPEIVVEPETATVSEAEVAPETITVPEIRSIPEATLPILEAAIAPEPIQDNIVVSAPIIISETENVATLTQGLDPKIYKAETALNLNNYQKLQHIKLNTHKEENNRNKRKQNEILNRFYVPLIALLSILILRKSQLLFSLANKFNNLYPGNLLDYLKYA